MLSYCLDTFFVSPQCQFTGCDRTRGNVQSPYDLASIWHLLVRGFDSMWLPGAATDNVWLGPHVLCHYITDAWIRSEYRLRHLRCSGPECMSSRTCGNSFDWRYHFLFVPSLFARSQSTTPECATCPRWFPSPLPDVRSAALLGKTETNRTLRAVWGHWRSGPWEISARVSWAD